VERSQAHLGAVAEHQEDEGEVEQVGIELARPRDLSFEVADIGPVAEPQFLHLRGALLAARFRLLLVLLVLELAVIEDAADRGLSGGRDLDQIEIGFLRPAQGRPARRDGPAGNGCGD